MAEHLYIIMMQKATITIVVLDNFIFRLNVVKIATMQPTNKFDNLGLDIFNN